MAAGGDISNLLDSLPSSSDQFSILQKLNTILTTTHPKTLRDVVLNTSFDSLFECLDCSDESGHLELCAEVLDRLLSLLSSSLVLHNFHSKLKNGLEHSFSAVKELALSQLTRVSKEIVEELMSYTDIVKVLVELLGSNSLSVSKSARSILTNLGNTPDGLSLLFQGEIYHCIRTVMEKGDVIRFRVYQLAVDISKFSPCSLEGVVASDLLQLLLNELYKDDLLAQMNCLELVTELALTDHGFAYLDRSKVVDKLDSLLKAVETDPLLQLIQPGLIKFFGNIARHHPTEICSKYETFVNQMLASLASPDFTLRCIAIETVGFVGGTPKGKMALGNQMDSNLQSIGATLRDAPTEVRAKTLMALASLLKLNVHDQTEELLSLTERWFSLIAQKPFEMLMSVSRQPLPSLQCPAYQVFISLALQPWGQKLMNEYPGFNEFLLDRSSEHDKDGKECKFEIVSTLRASPSAVEIFGQPYWLRLNEYYNEGPFYVKTETSIAMEGGT